MKSKTLLNVINCTLLLLLLASCDRVVHIDSYVTWNIENRSSNKLTIRKSYSCEKYIEHELLYGENYKLVCNSYNHSDTSLFKSPSDEYCSVCIVDEGGKCLFSKELLINSNWSLDVKDGDLIPEIDKSSYAKDDTWYDYTFTITDEMLEAARKGGGE